MLMVSRELVITGVMVLNVIRSSPMIVKGFTLVELLVVMGILGVLAAGLIALLNPADRVNAANDTKALSDMNQTIKAIQTYSAVNNGSYNATGANVTVWGSAAGQLGAMLTNELTNLPTSTVRTYSVNLPLAGTTMFVSTTLVSKKYSTQAGCTASTTYAFYSNATGKLCGFCGASAPTQASACAAWSL